MLKSSHEGLRIQRVNAYNVNIVSFNPGQHWPGFILNPREGSFRKVIKTEARLKWLRARRRVRT